MPREWDWVCVVPVAGPVHVFEGLLATIEDDLLPGFLFVDNSRDSFLRDYDLKGARVVYHPENLGVAKSWNLALREGHEQTIICSASMRFDRGGFRAALDMVDRGANAWGMFTWESWHLTVIGRATVEQIGLIDENFYPAYGEDLDYMRRMIVAGIISGHPPDGSQHPCRPAPVSCVGNAIAVSSGCVKPADPSMWLGYYARKWGGGQAHETFPTPFGDPANGLDFWVPATVAELKERNGLA